MISCWRILNLPVTCHGWVAGLGWWALVGRGLYQHNRGWLREGYHAPVTATQGRWKHLGELDERLVLQFSNVRLTKIQKQQIFR